MAIFTKLQRSQNSHLKLQHKYTDFPGLKGDILYRYHRNIIKIQHANKRIISKSERRKVFNTVSLRCKRGKK